MWHMSHDHFSVQPQAAHEEHVGWETVGIGVGWAPMVPQADL